MTLAETAEVHRMPRALLVVASRAGHHDVLGPVAAAKCQRHHMVDVILLADLAAAPVTPPALPVVLRTHVGGGVTAGSGQSTSAVPMVGCSALVWIGRAPRKLTSIGFVPVRRLVGRTLLAVRFLVGKAGQPLVISEILGHTALGHVVPTLLAKARAMACTVPGFAAAILLPMGITEGRCGLSMLRSASHTTTALAIPVARRRSVRPQKVEANGMVGRARLVTHLDLVSSCHAPGCLRTAGALCSTAIVA